MRLLPVIFILLFSTGASAVELGQVAGVRSYCDTANDVAEYLLQNDTEGCWTVANIFPCEVTGFDAFVDVGAKQFRIVRCIPLVPGPPSVIFTVERVEGQGA